jgi:hypothetical protein
VCILLDKNLLPHPHSFARVKAWHIYESCLLSTKRIDLERA